MRNCIFDIKGSSLIRSNTHDDTAQAGKKFHCKEFVDKELNSFKILLVQIRAGQKLSCNYFTWFLKAYHQRNRTAKGKENRDTSLRYSLSYPFSNEGRSKQTNVNRYAKNKGPEELGRIKTQAKNSKRSHKEG